MLFNVFVHVLQKSFWKMVFRLLRNQFPLSWFFFQFAPSFVVACLKTQNPFRYLFARLLHNISYCPNIFLIVIRKQSNRLSCAASSSSSSNSVNIADQTLWKIVIDNLIDSFEIDSTRHQISANKHPYLANTEFLYDLISFFFLFVSVYDVHVLSVIS